MDALNFAYWLNGFSELHGDTPPTDEQWKAIREHLGLVFSKVTPAVKVSQEGPNEIVIVDSHWWNRPATNGTPLGAEC